MGGLRDLIDSLVHGIKVNDLDLIGFISRGRFREEFNINLIANGHRVLTLKVFLGRGPYYEPWIKVFNIEPFFWG